MQTAEITKNESTISTGDVFRSGKFPQSEQAWLALRGVEEVYEQIGGLSTQCAVFSPLNPDLNCGQGTVFVGGVPQDPLRRLQLPVVNKLFGYVAAGAATSAEDASLGISFNWPGQGKSEGNIMSTTIESRVSFVEELVEHFQEKYSLNQINLVGMSMGSYCVIMAANRLPKGTVRSIVALSPAAYPEKAHQVPYGQDFQSIIRSNWDIMSSPARSIIQDMAVRGMMAFFEYDAPPIPLPIQHMYRQLAGDNPNMTNYTIAGVEHNFRRPFMGSNARNVIDNESVRKFGDKLVDFLGASL